MNLEKFKNLQFLSPRLTIKINHLTKDDTRHVKNQLNNKLGFVSFFIAIGLALVSVAVFLMLQISSGWKQIEVYGISSFIGVISCFALSMATLILRLFALKTKKEKAIIALNRIEIILLYLAVATFMFSSFYADAEKGFLSKSPTISVGIIVIAFLLIVQPVFALDAWILNSGTIIVMIALVIYAKIQFNIESFIYYILIAVVFLSMSRLFISINFYAEVQKYIQESISNSLLDTAMYDELTHCKNRFALKKFLEEKNPIWKAKKTRLLIVMFDIDNFKEYNDYFSHQVGDGCLRNIASAVKAAFPSPSLEFYRYGGEEFLLIFELEEGQNAKEILESLRCAASELDIKAPPTSLLDHLTISVGGYFSNTNNIFDFEIALNEADANLYRAKADGKNVCYLNNKKVDRREELIK